MVVRLRCAALLLSLSGARARTISVRLSAPWPTTPLSPILETAEFMSEESGAEFWNFVSALRTHPDSSAIAASETDAYSEATHESMASLAVDIASASLSPLQLSALRLTLAIRSFAPLIETHRSLAAVSFRVCPSSTRAWVVLTPSGRVVCQPVDLASALGGGERWSPTVEAETEDPLQEIDHTWQGSSAAAPSAGAPVATLYGRLGSAPFWAFHEVLVAAQQSGAVRWYRFRHGVPPPLASTVTNLQGYGVNLDIKNMEYMNLDERKGEANATVSFPEGEEVGGFVFSTLLRRLPEQASALASVRAALLAESDELAVWKVKDLGLQATAAIVADRNPLRRLAEISQNFPVHAKALGSTKVARALRDEVEYNHGSLRSLGAGSLLLVNGRTVDIGQSTFNLFTLIRDIRAETRQLAKLSQLRLPAATSRALLKLGASGAAPTEGETEVRVNLVTDAKGAIVFLNNLEKDAQYKRWPRQLAQLLYPSWSLHTLARNLYTMVLVLDPTTDQGLAAIEAARGLHQQGYPVRFGFVFTSPALIADLRSYAGVFAPPAQAQGQAQAQAKAQGAGTAATAAQFVALLAAANARSFKAGLAFLDAASRDLASGYTAADAAAVYTAAVAEAESSWAKAELAAEADAAIASVAQGSGPGLDLCRLMTVFASSKGLPVNKFLLNGLLSTDLDLGQPLLQLLGKEQHLLQRLVHGGVIADGKRRADGKAQSVLGALMQLPTVVSRYHRLAGEAPSAMRFAVPPKGLAYLHPQGTRAQAKAVSYVLTGDWASRVGLERAREAMAFLETGAAEAAAAVADAGAGAGAGAKVGENIGAGAGGDEEESSADDTSVAGKSRVALLLSSQALSPAAHAVQAVVREVAAGNDPNGVGLLKKWLDRLLDVSLGQSKTSELTVDTVVETAGSLGLSAAATAAAAAAAAASAGNEGLKPEERMRKELAEVLGGAGGAAVVANGRCVALDPDEPFTSGDFKLLGSLVHSRAQAVAELVDAAPAPALAAQGSEAALAQERAAGEVADWRSDAVAVAAAFLGQYTQVPREDVGRLLGDLRTDHTFLNFGGDSGGDSGNNGGGGGEDDEAVGSVTITAVLDPLTEAAQRVAPLLSVLQAELHVPLQVLLLPDPSLEGFPLKKFYRYVVGADVGDVRPAALFEKLPRRHVLTMRMDVPEPWNVQSSSAQQDVDNLRCDDVGCGDEAPSGEGEGAAAGAGAAAAPRDMTRIAYTLKSLLAAGQCFDGDRRPPNGLPLRLTRLGGGGEHDTLVMQNLGYFQFSAAPGVWRVELQGRGKELFDIAGPEGGAVPHQPLRLASFDDQSTALRVRKQRGKEGLSLLDGAPGEAGAGGLAAAVEADGAASYLGSLAGGLGSLFGGGGLSGASLGSGGGGKKGKDTVHVFSLATGHLYERFLKIMMLSVVKRCSQPVKFWLFENFLSPTFKDSASAMASEYGFDLAFVSYKWPAWLRNQSSKQRIIWGYKILFLDVLFPLNVSKVIYVDSDQTVRGDLVELWNMDLKGKPYAYVPFCDSRKETLGYQFWRQGYWKDHLRGKPYHISALYVVDLAKFRAMAAGDQLRAIYENLSRDPNSLSNLDQDLPNYAQGMIPIFSLPQEWLWCESWCSDATKSKAKTIDLCNNPMHKEPKLDMAKRVISGELFKESWLELDEEIRALEVRRRVGTQREAKEASLDMGFG